MMKHLYICFALVFATASASDVLDLNDSNFQATVASMEIVLVEFFAPWCGHCKKLAPEYEQAATELKSEDPPIPLAKVDCTANTDVCGKHGVSGYPTLKIFRGGEVSQDYSGPRDAAGIASYMRKISGPASKQLTDVEQWRAYTNKPFAVLIGYFEEGSSDLKDFQNAASALREDYKFAHTTNEDVLAAAGVEKNVVKLYRPKILASIFEDQVVTMDQKPTTGNCRTFLDANSLGLCGHLTPENLNKFKKPLVITFDEKLDYKLNPKGSNYWRNRVMKFGKKFADRLNFAVANRGQLSNLVAEAGLPESDSSEKYPKPAVLILNKDDKKFVMPELFTPKGFEQFLEDYLADKIAPHIKSEAIPESNDGPVTVVTGKTFDEIVMDDTKDVLIEFYAPWCGHCKSLEPKWTELGEKLKDNDEIVIAKIDATANDYAKQFQVSGFPTIYWAPKDNKKSPEKYSGGREVTEFIKFLKTKASSKLKTEL